MHMKLNRAVGTLLGGVALLASSACADLDVANPNNPDIRRALSSPEDVVNIANSTLFNWYRSVTYLQPFAALSVTSDNHTANFGNFGMRFNNVEPRIPYDNSSASGDAGVAESPWENSYADLGLGNDVMIALKNGISLGSPEEDAKYAALAQFTQAASLSSLAQLFDQAFIVDENTDLSVPPELKPHAEVAAAAEAKWDALIASLATQDAEYDAGVLPLTSGDGDYSLSAGRSIPLTSATLAQLANTLAAQHLAYMPRNAAENEAVNWGKVLQYAENGISKADNRFDFAIMQDGGTKWFSYVVYYGAEKSWMRTDMRLMNLMNPALPAP